MVYKGWIHSNFHSVRLLYFTVCNEKSVLCSVEDTIIMERCMDCSRVFKNNNSLRVHKYNFHRDQASNNQSTIAITNSRNKDNIGFLHSLDSMSGESSDSDSTIDSEDEVVTTNKRVHVPDSSDEEPPAKIHRRNKLTKRRKRKRAPDQSDDDQPERKIRKKKSAARNKDPGDAEEYVYVSDTDEEDIAKIPKYEPPPRRKSRTPYYLNDLVNKDTEIRELKREIEELREEIRGFVGFKAGCESKILELERLFERERDLRKKEQQQRELLAMQFENYKENVIEEMTPLDIALMNSVTIEQINVIRHYLKVGDIDPILNDENKLLIIQRILAGMSEGIIPITNPQNLIFTKSQKSFMSTLKTIGLDEAKDYIEESIQDFLEIFEIMDMSLKLVTKAFNKYGQKTYK